MVMLCYLLPILSHISLTPILLTLVVSSPTRSGGWSEEMSERSVATERDDERRCSETKGVSHCVISLSSRRRRGERYVKGERREPEHSVSRERRDER